VSEDTDLVSILENGIGCGAYLPGSPRQMLFHRAFAPNFTDYKLPKPPRHIHVAR